ncbi:MAG: hypothetical protein FWF49_02645 [Oscillospiraceae bacterium]|nr:hypothetical protein [Oscillospiraceae bacterium]
MALKENDLAPRAKQALADMTATWWEGTAEGGNAIPTRNGYPSEWPAGGAMPWEMSMMMTCLYTDWLIQGRPAMSDDVSRFSQQWRWLTERLGSRLVEMCGIDWPNPAVDDTGWNSVNYMMTYHITRDPTALEAAKAVVAGGFEAFKSAPPGAADETKDRSAKNGLWYSQHPPSLGFDRLGNNKDDNRHKSLYTAALVMTALDLLLLEKAAGGDWQKTHAALWEDALGAYNWMETNLLRASAATADTAATNSVPTLPATFAGGLQDGGDYTILETVADNLYWCDYNVGRTGADFHWGFIPAEKDGPRGGSSGSTGVKEHGSFSFLGGNMAMAICHARLYRLTGEDKYRARAVRTARALTDSPDYNRDGVLANDRDAWVDGFFAGIYVEEVLTLPGVRDEDVELIINTGRSAYDTCRLTVREGMDFAYVENPEDAPQNIGKYLGKVFYRAEWSGGDAWTKDAKSPTQPTQVMTCGSTANMIIAGAYAEELREKRDLL